MPDAIRVRVGCDLGLATQQVAHAILQIEPSRIGRVAVLSEEWIYEPNLALRGYRDVYGNLCQRIDLPEGACSIRYDAIVEVAGHEDLADLAATEDAATDLPDEVLVYTLPSRYCLSDELADDAWRLFGSTPRGWGRVQSICDFVHAEIRFQYGTSTPLTTAVDVWERKVGVCRDFAQLAISFCRALNIPARYVFGYLPDIDVPPDPARMDFAAWMEVWLGGHWYTFDPRTNQRRVGRILVGRGRDALDCAMLTSYGRVELPKMVVWADQEMNHARGGLRG